MICLASSYILLLLLVLLLAVFIWEMRRSLKRSSVTNRLIGQYLKADTVAVQRELIAKIYAYCLNDFKLRRIIHRYQASEEDFFHLYKKLKQEADFKKRRRYVPISAFFYVYTLEYILKHRDFAAKKLAMKCMNFFHF